MESGERTPAVGRDIVPADNSCQGIERRQAGIFGLDVSMHPFGQGPRYGTQKQPRRQPAEVTHRHNIGIFRGQCKGPSSRGHPRQAQPLIRQLLLRLAQLPRHVAWQQETDFPAFTDRHRQEGFAAFRLDSQPCSQRRQRA